MRARLLSLFLIVTVAVSACTAEASGPAGPSSGLVAIGAGLQGRDGLVAERYATGLVHAASFAFDGEGRLWAGTAAFEDDGTDGVYLVGEGDVPVLVLDDVATVMGLLWLDDVLYVSSAAGVDAYSGFDGAAFSDHTRIVTVPDGTGLVGGLALGPDGRLVVGISAPCDACTPSSAWSASVLSFLLDGSDARVEATGIRAPVGLAFLPGESTLYVTMNQRDDLGDDTPGDWLGVVTSGDDWGFPDCDGQDGSACDDVPDPVAVLDRHAAAAGLAFVGRALSGTPGTTAVVAEWASGKVVGVSLDAATTGMPVASTTFLTGFANPVAMVTAPDGSLLVGDWSSGVVYHIAAER